MIAELACAHVFLFDGWPLETVSCPRCRLLRPIVAIECREWKVTCYTCRFARWCGQSQGVALDRRVAHHRTSPGHKVTVDYLAHPDNQKKLKSLYKRVKPRIMGDVMYPTDYEVALLEAPPCAMCGLRSECKCVPF